MIFQKNSIKWFPRENRHKGRSFYSKQWFSKFKWKICKPKKCSIRLFKTKKSRWYKKNTFKIYCLHICFEKGLKVKNQFDFIKKLNEWGFKTNQQNKLISGVKNLIKNYKEIEKRLDIDYDIDGIVYKVKILNFKEG